MNNPDFDTHHIWHPYSAVPPPYPVYEVVATEGVTITLADGRQLVDGMSSWWSAIHGYNHPALVTALTTQANAFSHVMFGGLTHNPAIRLAQQLIDITAMDTVFFADSGSVSVEVALKMALQFHMAQDKPNKNKFISLHGAYHGDTLGAMSVCDPVNSMHRHFGGVVPRHLFIPRPQKHYHDSNLDPLRHLLDRQHDHIAALIIEPVVQGAGGMHFYDPEYLRQFRKLCDAYDILLIADEIATGFGRTGTLFACEQANITPDILCIGKALTGGMMSLAATLTTRTVSDTISAAPPHLFMHGPTFMGNPLACAVASASIELLLTSDWHTKIHTLSAHLKHHLSPCRRLTGVRDVRVLGAIGVVELNQNINMAILQPLLVHQGIWVRPFGKLVYIMPTYTIRPHELEALCGGIFQALSVYLS
jgi:adenosylmethionine---8-amino-7-oxononanoate aminotransferase